MSPRLRTLAAGVLGLAALSLTACQDDASSSASPPPTASATSGTPSSTGTTDTSSPTGASTDSSTGPAAATGPELTEKVASLHAPDGFTVATGNVSSFDVSASRGSDLLTLIELPGMGTTISRDEQYQNLVASLPKGSKPQRLPDVQVAQDRTWAVEASYTDGTGSQNLVLLASRSQTQVTVTYSFSPESAATSTQDWASIIASLSWVG